MKKTANFAELFFQADQHLKLGQLQEAATILNRVPRQVPMKKWQPEECHRFAELCRRSGLFTAGLKALAPLVRGEKGELLGARVEWIVTYAGLLNKIGSLQESIQLLESCRPRIPECELYTAYAYIGQWDHASAQIYLERFLSASGVVDYQLMVGRVNLSAVLVKTEQWQAADDLLLKIEAECLKKGWTLLLRNSYEIRAELAQETGAWDLAEAQLKAAEKFSGQGRYDLFVAVQRARLAAKLGNNSSAVLKQIRSVRSHAENLNHFESLRSLDLILANFTRDPALADKIYFGTPYPAFRERILRSSSEWYRPAAFYKWNPGPAGASEFDFDVFHGSSAHESIKLGQGTHRLLRALTQDFYRPTPIGLLQSHLFPGQYLNPLTSPQRVANVVHRARDWFSESQSPLGIHVEQHQFSLTSQKPCALNISLESLAASQETLGPRATLNKLKPVLAADFTAENAAAKLDVSIRSANNLIKWGCENKVLVKQGAGRATRYKFAA